VFAQSPVPQGNSGAQTAFRAVTEAKPAVAAPETKAFVPMAETEEKPPLRMRDDTAEDLPISVPVIPKPIVTAPPVKETPLPQQKKEEPPVVTEEEIQPTPRIVGEIFTTYILAEYGDELLVIDKHAAHERILYNTLKNTAEPAAQMLLEPVAVTLDSEACNALLTALPLLAKAGYIVEDFGGLTVLVRAVPVMLSGCDVTAVIEEIAGGLASGKRDILTGKEDWIYHSIACRAAIKAGDATTLKEQQALVERVLEDAEVRYCPHGRPVCFVMTKKELEKQFGRIQ